MGALNEKIVQDRERIMAVCSNDMDVAWSVFQFDSVQRPRLGILRSKKPKIADWEKQG